MAKVSDCRFKGCQNRASYVVRDPMTEKGTECCGRHLALYVSAILDVAEWVAVASTAHNGSSSDPPISTPQGQ